MSDQNNSNWESFAPSPTANSSTFKILVIDDSPFVRAQVKDILGNLMVTLVEAEDGEDGWQKLQKHSDIRFVLCDVNMPKLDGLGLIKRISDKMGKVSFPIVMLTTENQLDKVLAAKKYGATAWLIKPPQPQDLQKIVKKFLEQTKKAS
ncbi:MAG: response regulator [Proteobacteria bacterium]|nr:response regulator [Pseudomonadota bacterium]